MGLLSEGTPLTWLETKKYTNHVKEHGIKQFINHFASLRNRISDCLKWGDEIEYIIVKFDHTNKMAKVSLKSSKLLEELREAEEKNPMEVKSAWHPEYAEYMVEGTPGHPYGSLVQHFNIVEYNMAFRRNQIQALLEEDEVALSLTNFFRLGCPGFTHPSATPNPKEGASLSLFFPDAAIAECHPRFKTLTRNIRERRGEKVAINVPIFKDEFTPSPFVEDLAAFGDDGSSSKAAKPDHVYMDAMGFGMGCSCLQMTFQARTVSEARVLYDQLTPLCPIMLALTAASPIYKGYLTDIDCRWDVISASVDCRTREERGLTPLKENKFIIPKSRYSSVDLYLSECGSKYNDLEVVYDEEIYQHLMDCNIDNLMAKHISHLFIRDTISLFSERIYQNDDEELDHFENIQSTNWQTMRFKVPPTKGNIGWRVEFRPCELQITDFENAAFGIFIVLLTRAILTFKLNMLMPISKVDENMERSQKRKAVIEEKFWFREDVFSRDCDNGNSSITEMTIDEIINGKGEQFVGLVPLIKQYLSALDCDADTACSICQYLKLISLRASGEAMTTASWIRDFVTTHPEYLKDSVVSERIAYDLLVEIKDVTLGKACVQLLGGIPKTKTAEDIPKALQKLLKDCCL